MTTLYATASREHVVYLWQGSNPMWYRPPIGWSGSDAETDKNFDLTDDAFMLLFGVTDTPPADECWEYESAHQDRRPYVDIHGWRRVKINKPPAPASYYAQKPAAPGEPPTPVVEPTNPLDEMRDDIAFLKRAVAKVSPEYIELSLNGVKQRLERLERIPTATDCLVCEQDLRDVMKRLKALEEKVGTGLKIDAMDQMLADIKELKGVAVNLADRLEKLEEERS